MYNITVSEKNINEISCSCPECGTIPLTSPRTTTKINIKSPRMTTKINIKKLKSEAKLPTRGSEYAAGYDLYSTDFAYIPPHETIKLGTGVAIELPDYTFGAIFARSGLATKQGLRPANCVGVIDSDYRGEIIVAIYNDSNETKLINTGDRIAQLVVIPYVACEFNEVEELLNTDRGDGGFGSTGIN